MEFQKHLKRNSNGRGGIYHDTIEENGGDVWLNNGAARITVSDDRIRGVVAEDGTEIACPHVVSNADPMHTCLQLIERRNVPSWYLRQLASLSAGGGVMSLRKQDEAEGWKGR